MNLSSSTIPSPAELRYFVEVSSTGNVSRAAERLGISQPTLSLAIRRLEDCFGTALLIRTKSGVTLTHAGQKLVSQARSLLLEWNRIRDDALKSELSIQGRYVIGAHPSVALYAFPELIPSLLTENPQLEIKLTHDLSRKICEDVISFKVDFGIVVNPWKHPDLIIKPLCKDEVTLWTRSDPTEEQDPKSDKSVLICDPDLLQSQSILKQLSRKGFNFSRVVTSSNLEVVTALVASGTGVGILPGRVATREKHLGLRVLDPAAPKFTDRHCLVFRADAQNTKASRQLAKQIMDSIGQSLTTH